jgi:hypothetical protein
MGHAPSATNAVVPILFGTSIAVWPTLRELIIDGCESRRRDARRGA